MTGQGRDTGSTLDVRKTKGVSVDDPTVSGQNRGDSYRVRGTLRPDASLVGVRPETSSLPPLTHVTGHVWTLPFPEGGRYKNDRNDVRHCPVLTRCVFTTFRRQKWVSSTRDLRGYSMTLETEPEVIDFPR